MLKKIAFLFGIFLSSSTMAGIESRGMVEAISLEAGSIQIEGQSYRLTPGKVEVIYEENKLDASILGKGMFVRFSVSAEGSVEQIWLIGPDNKIQQALNQ